MNIIPSVNLKDFTSGDSSKKQQFVDAIGKAYERESKELPFYDR